MEEEKKTIDSSMNSSVDNGCEEWCAGFENLNFEQSAERMRDQILKSPELDKKSRQYFTDAFAYVMRLHKENKPLDTNLMRIHMVDIKGYKGISVQEFGRVLLLLAFCGFEFSYQGKK